MSDQRVSDVSRRAPAVLVLLALLTLLVSVCHGPHGHALPTSGAATFSAPRSRTAATGPGTTGPSTPTSPRRPPPRSPRRPRPPEPPSCPTRRTSAPTPAPAASAPGRAPAPSREDC
ncbi:hypothetical protein O1L60_20295 [Streptomyces diastatochromogenes]|nr:hypothetical protein [Streptomyces diastatochromogenes]